MAFNKGDRVIVVHYSDRWGGRIGRARKDTIKTVWKNTGHFTLESGGTDRWDQSGKPSRRGIAGYRLSAVEPYTEERWKEIVSIVKSERDWALIRNTIRSRMEAIILPLNRPDNVEDYVKLKEELESFMEKKNG